MAHCLPNCLVLIVPLPSLFFLSSFFLSFFFLPFLLSFILLSFILPFFLFLSFFTSGSEGGGRALEAHEAWRVPFMDGAVCLAEWHQAADELVVAETLCKPRTPPQVVVSVYGGANGALRVRRDLSSVYPQSRVLCLAPPTDHNLIALVC